MVKSDVLNSGASLYFRGFSVFLLRLLLDWLVPSFLSARGNWSNLVHLHEQPIEEIREYFGTPLENEFSRDQRNSKDQWNSVFLVSSSGENIAFYFAWVGFFTDKLLIPGLIGLLVFLVQLWYDPHGRFEDKTSATYLYYFNNHSILTDPI